MKEADTEDRGKQIAVGGLIMLLISVCVISLLLFWRLIPGWVGETVGLLAGVVSTPFFLEATFALLGFLIVVLLNSWRRKAAGDEFVEVDEKDLPAEYRSARGDGEQR